MKRILPGRRLASVVLLFWVLVGCVYVWAAWQQKLRLNLSAAAGGQYPYLVYAKGIAEAGVTRHFGDRNRMPLYPTLLAMVYDEDWDTFVERAGRFAIVSSLGMLAGIGAIAYLTLPTWPATAMTLAVAICVYLRQASFVQAELLYYTLLFASWLTLCRLIARPDWRWASLAGVLLACTYLTKSSALPTLGAFMAVMIIRGVALLVGATNGSSPDRAVMRRRAARNVLLSTAVVAGVFLAIAYPYISHNKTRFGSYFYNVNSKFFMWCDSWAEAKTFADSYHISEQYPVATPDEIPGPINYWRTHSSAQMLHRLGYGFKTLGSLALAGSYFKYLALAAVMCLGFALTRLRCVKTLLIEHWAVVLFCTMLVAGYSLAYAWYVPVAYGDRFVLSLFLPAMFAAFSLARRFSRLSANWSFFGRTVGKCDAFALVMVVLLVVEGAATVTATLYRPDQAFVRFYYNESRELLAAGNLKEAAKGFSGVIRLEPTFAPAHHELGMIAIAGGRFGKAVGSLTEAARLKPLDANMQNSLGSALFQAGRAEEAILAFRRATELDESLASAWYNLGGALLHQNRQAETDAVQRRLETLNPDLARQLTRITRD